jgi:hypothetical protein
MPGGLPVKYTTTKGMSCLTALFALVLGCAIMVAPLWPRAAHAADTRVLWTAIEAEIARQYSDGVSLRRIINNSVRSGERIHEVVEACIKVGIDPSLVVYTAINEGYAAKTVVKAAIKAGARLNAVVNSATHAGMDEQSTYVGDLVEAAVKTGVDPSLLVYTAITEGFSSTTVIRATLLAGASLYTVIKSAAHARPENMPGYCGEVVAAVIQTGEDPSLVVYTAITQEYPASVVVRAALLAGAPLEAVVRSATQAGADKKSIYVGAADAGAAPGDVEVALSAAHTPGEPIFIFIPSTASFPPLPVLDDAPATFEMGGIVLSQVPAWTTPSMPFGPVMINPYFSVSETFSDNVFYTRDDKKSDTIAKITPGVRLQLPFRDHVAELAYYSVFARYGKNTGENINDHHIGGSVDFKVNDRFKLRLSDNLERGHEPQSSTPTGTNEVFHSNVAAVAAFYQFTNKFTAHLDIGRSTWRFVNEHFRDRAEDQVVGAVLYQLVRQATVFIEYGQRKIAYVDDALDLDSAVGTTQAGLSWDFSARSKGTIKAGVAHKNFSSSTQSSGTVKVGSADVRHEFASDTTIELTARRSMNEPDIPGSVYFISTGAYAELTQRIIPQWSAVVRGAFVQDLYFSRTDRTSLGGVGVRYQANDWLGVAVDYNRNKRNSNVQGNEYTEQSSIVMVSVSL